MMVYKGDGFEGQKLISLPSSIYKNIHLSNPLLSQLFVTHIGYFPKAAYHFRERKNGCEDNILIYCLSGKGYLSIANKEYTVSPNQFIHIPATTECFSYGADENDPWTIYWVHYSGKEIDLFNSSLAIKEDTGPIHLVFNEKSIDTWEAMYQSLEMGYSRDNVCNANLCLYYFLATFFYPEKHVQPNEDDPKDMLTKTILYMRSNLNKVISIEEFAALHHLSPSYFSSLFKKTTGMSPGDYFIQLKMQKACQMLYNPSRRVKEVAFEIGYNDPHYFSRLFKKFMGVSPENYRNLKNKSNNHFPSL